MAAALEQRIVTHEVGHAMSLDHGNNMNQPNTNGIMNTSAQTAPDAANAKFIDKHLNALRKLSKPHS